MCDVREQDLIHFLRPQHKLKELRNLVRQSECVVVSVSERFRATAQAALHYARALHRPYVVWIHTRLSHTYFTMPQGRALKRAVMSPYCRAVVCVSRAVLGDVKTNFGSLPHAHTVYPGVYQAQRFEQATTIPDQGGIDVLFSGRLCREKGGDIFIQALGELAKEGVRPRVVMMGDGEEKRALIGLAKELGVFSSLSFVPTGTRSELFARIRHARIFCVASRSESFSITLAEALALGATVVAPDTGGPREITGSGEFGYLFKTGDAHDLARALRVALSQKRLHVLAQKLHAIQKFDAARQFRSLARIITQYYV
ncbi:MAG: glycosyltransferase [Patescibacteria group bacterium]